MSSEENTLAEVNRKFWDTGADLVFGQEWVQNLARQITDFLHANIAWLGLEPAGAVEGSGLPVSMLDYACGNGAASRALLPYISTVRGIDVSGGMVERYNQAARLQGLSKQQMYAVQGDLQSPTAQNTHPELQGEDFVGFHVIVVNMALHHMEKPQELLTRLVERLRDGGAVVIIDWLPENGKPGEQPAIGGSHIVTQDQEAHSHQHGQHLASHTVAHAGFTKDQMQKMLREAGCSEVDYILHPERSTVPPEIGGQKQLFFARGRK